MSELPKHVGTGRTRDYVVPCVRPKPLMEIERPDAGLILGADGIHSYPGCR
jgi:hypothetical protein